MKSSRVAAMLGAGALAACLLGACGQRGPLVLPKPPEPPSAGKAGKPRAPAAAGAPAASPASAPETR
jgi:hypothetical protein